MARFAIRAARYGQRMASVDDEQGQGRKQLPELVVSLIESLARYMDCEQGNWTIELQLENGSFSRYRRHHGPAGASSLEQFAKT